MFDVEVKVSLIRGITVVGKLQSILDEAQFPSSIIRATA